LLVAAFLARGAYLSVALPYGAPLDERFHYAYASFFAAEGRPPRGDELSISVEERRASLALPRPSVWEQGEAGNAYFYRLDAAERARRRAEAFAFRPAERTEWWFANYESQQPPLAYTLSVPLLRILADAPIDKRLLALRLFGALLASMAVPVVYALMRRFLEGPTALTATAAYVAFPGLGMFVGRFTNDDLALPLMAGVLLMLVVVAGGGLTPYRAAGLATLLAAGLWTKLYFLAMLPAVLSAAALAPKPTRRRALTLAAATVVAAGISILPWLARQRAATGDWLGIKETVWARAMGITAFEQLRALRWFVSPGPLAILGRTFVWPGTWTWTGAPWPVSYAMTAGLVAVALLVQRPASQAARRGVAALALALFWFLVAQAFHATSFAAMARHTHTTPAGQEGWYLLSLLPVLLLAGEAIGRTRRRAFAALAALGLLSDAVLQFGFLPACYAGVLGVPGVPLTAGFALAARPGVAFPILGVFSLPAWRGRWIAALAIVWLALLTASIALVARTRQDADARPSAGG
jgi:hypothetical protein